MSSLRELERDVHQFLSNLAHVKKVEVEASTTTRGRKKCEVRTFIDSDTREDRFRVYDTETLLTNRHRSVLFDFRCHTLKATDEQRTVEPTNTT
jgi:hypothetical protein